jgi:hypothetical protein
VVNYRILPDADGDGADEIVVVNTASVAPNGNVVADPIAAPQIIEGSITRYGMDSPVNSVTGQPGTLFQLKMTGMNPASAGSNVAIFQSNGNQETIEVPTNVRLFTSDGLQQLLTMGIPLLSPGPATVKFLNKSTGRTSASLDIVVEALPDIGEQAAQKIIDDYLSDVNNRLDILNTVATASNNPQYLRQVSQLSNDLQQLRTKFAEAFDEVSKIPEPDVRATAMSEMASVALYLDNIREGVIPSANLAQTCSERDDFDDLRALQEALSAAADALTLLALGLAATGAGAGAGAVIGLMALLLQASARAIQFAVHYASMLRDATPGECPPPPPPCPPSGTSPSGPTGMGSAPPPGGDGCGDTNSRDEDSLQLSGISSLQQQPDQIMVKVFTNGGTRPFTGLTDAGGYFFVPLIPANIPFTAIAFNMTTGETRSWKGTGPKTGDSVFMFFDFTQDDGSGLGEIELDQTVSGEIEAEEQFDLYTFKIDSFQRVSFDDLSGNVRWRLDEFGGESVASWTSGDDGPFDLLAGQYLLSIDTTGDAPGAYQFKVQAAPLQRFAIEIGDTIGPVVPGGGAGNLEDADAIDIYTFTATAGQRVFIDMLEFENWPWLELVDPTGNVILARALGCFFCADIGIATLPKDGLYSIIVGRDSWADDGTYQFKLWEVPAPNEFDIAIGDTVSNGIPGAGAGNIEIPGSRDIYRFNATAGQQVYFDVIEIEINTLLTLIDPSGEQVFEHSTNCIGAGCADPKIFTLEQGGLYTLFVGSDTSSDRGTYSLKLWNVPAPQEFDIAIGDTVSDGVPQAGAGNIETTGSEDIYRFTASAGQQIFLDLLAYNVEGFWQLRSPTDEALYDNWLGPNPGLFTLEEAGEYRIIVFGNLDYTGDYSFKVWDVPAPQEFDIAIGDTVSDGVPAAGAGNIEVPGSRDRYRFTATAGQSVNFTILASEISVPWELRDPSFVQVFEGCLGCSDPGTFVLEEGGVYTLIVGSDSNGEQGTYSFKVALP